MNADFSYTMRVSASKGFFDCARRVAVARVAQHNEETGVRVCTAKIALSC